MNKPEGFSNIQIGASMTPGGHKCEIKKVEETKSRSGSDMLIIYFDTTKEDSLPGFYSERYLADKKSTSKDPVWRGRQYLVTDGEYGPSNLKRFTTSVADSNSENSLSQHKWTKVTNDKGAEEWEPAWGNGFADSFKDLKVGVIFRIEEYTDQVTGEIRAAVKPFRFCAYDKALEQPVPERKNLPPQQPSLQQQYDQMSLEGFMKVPDDLSDEGLPFN